MKIGLFLSLFVFLCAGSVSAEEISTPEALRQKCTTEAELKNIFDCDCLHTKYKELLALKPKEWQAAYTALWVGVAKECVPPERIHAQTLQNCMEVSYDKNKDMDRTKVGKEGFCQCVADETVKRLQGNITIDSVAFLTKDNNRAMLNCKTKFMSAK